MQHFVEMKERLSMTKLILPFHNLKKCNIEQEMHNILFTIDVSF